MRTPGIKLAGPNVGPGNGLGDGGHRLHGWFLTSADAGHKAAAGRLAGVNREVMDELMSTGAVVVGRPTFELADGWSGDHHDGVPIFVLSRHQPDAKMRWPAVTYVSDVESAMHMAKDAAGEKDVLVHGADTAQRALTAGVLDELQIHLIPVLLGQGRRLFDNLPAEHIELDLVRQLTTPEVEELAQHVNAPALPRPPPVRSSQRDEGIDMGKTVMGAVVSLDGYCLDAIARLREAPHAIELMFVLHLLEALHDVQPDVRRELSRVAAFLPPNATMHVGGGLDDEFLRPLDYSPRPGGALRTQLDPTVITADLDRLEQRQQADGGWVVDFRSYSPAADLEWRGYATVEALSILHHNGRLASSGG